MEWFKSDVLKRENSRLRNRKEILELFNNFMMKLQDQQNEDLDNELLFGKELKLR